MDMLTVTPPTPHPAPPLVFLFSPSCCWSTPALQVQISCCLPHVNRARYKPFDWLNFHSSTKGKNAFLLMINDCKGDKPSTYMGFISIGGDFFPPLFSFPQTLSLTILMLIKGLPGTEWLHVHDNSLEITLKKLWWFYKEIKSRDWMLSLNFSKCNSKFRKDSPVPKKSTS